MRPSPRPPRPQRLSPGHLATVAALAVVLLAAVPGFAYTVIFKDGSRIATQEKYTIEGDKAILVLVNGTQASYDADKIDVARTEEFNKVNYGTARVIEGHTTRQVATDESLDDKVTLRDLVGRRGGLALPEPSLRSERDTSGAAEGGGDAAPRTKAGFVDLFTMPRDPYPDTAIMTEVLRYFQGQGTDKVRVYRGSQADRPLVEIVAPSEASVFKALEDSANGLVQIRERFPKDVAAFELLLVTENQVRAGQFTLTPKLANVLVTNELDAANFFLRYVEF